MSGPGSGGVRVTSEVGELETVLCHAPGPELTVVTPANRDEFLFDDLLDRERARREHDRFTAVLGRFARVLEVGDLLEEVLERPEARAPMLSRAEPAFRERARDVPADELARLFVEGEESGGGALSELLNEAGYSLPPLPNLFFTRDAAAVVGERVVIASMRHGVRWTEKLIMRTLFEHHPALANRGTLYDGTAEGRMHTSLEGGDIHVLREDLLLVGLSERTTAAGIDVLGERLLEDSPVRDVLVVLLPAHRASIHLDMIFTAVDRRLCCVYPPYFLGPTRLPVLQLSEGSDRLREHEDLFSALEELGSPMEPIRCGGRGRTMQQREQWGSGCNLFAVGPGRVVAYDRNEHTLEALEREGGLRTVDAVAFLTGEDRPEPDERFAVAFEGTELVRGGGGPRCMTLPVARKPLEAS